MSYNCKQYVEKNKSDSRVVENTESLLQTSTNKDLREFFGIFIFQAYKNFEIPKDVKLKNSTGLPSTSDVNPKNFMTNQFRVNTKNI